MPVYTKGLSKIAVAGPWAYEGGRRYRVHPTKRCPYCGGWLMLGNPRKNEWHCTNLSRTDFMAHYEASQLFERIYDKGSK